MFARSARLALVAFALVPVAAARAAAPSMWTPITSGTSATITAISTPHSGEVVFADGNGGIRYLNGTSFASASVTPANGLGFSDLAMSPSGVDGVAVGPSGRIYKSTDSGHSWTQVTGTMEYTASDCGTASTLAPLADNLSSVQYADGSTVYITGAHKDVLKSTDATASFTFTEVNKAADGTCKANPNEDFGDSAWLDANDGYLMSTYFGDIYFTPDGFANPLGSRKGEAVNSYQYPVALALDPTNHQRLFAVAAYPNGCGTLCFQVSNDGGTSWAALGSDLHPVALRDVSTAGGTTIAVGDGGDIFTTADGHTVYRRPSSTSANNNWNAVAVVSKSTAYVGGAGGLLLTTNVANLTPSQVAAQQNQPPSGSSPSTTKTGGASVTIFKKVTVSGRKGRFIPIKLSTTLPRKFQIALNLARPPHRTFSKLTVTIKKGTRMVHLPITKKVGTGTYQLVIRIFTTGRHGRQVGKSVKQIFVLS